MAHHVSVIGVQAGAARMALETSPAETRAALLVIESASREAVGEMHHLLSALRERDDVATGTEPPQPGLRDLTGLTESFAAAGLTVAVNANGTDAGLPPTQDLCCYRIIEEALTNVTRHSTAHTVTVDVLVTPTSTHIVVRDPGPPGVAAPGTGRGHVGMRERVALFGGTLTVGPDAAGSFVVDARIPRDGRRSTQ